MPGNSFGELFRITTFGESHGGGVGVVVDGCPAGLKLSERDIQIELDRRKPGQSEITSPRKEEDIITIKSGVFDGFTTGTPIMILAQNRDVRSEDYHHLRDVFRPSHADLTYQAKFGRVAAGAIAKRYLMERAGIRVISYVNQIGNISTQINPEEVSPEAVESSIVRCPDGSAALKMIDLIKAVQADGDSIGGVIRGVITGVPRGLGEPVFDRLHADLAKAMLSINAAKGFDIGLGFDCVGLRGSQHNDPFENDGLGGIRTRTNNAGGVLGGISSGSPILFRVAFKPVATISKEQDTVKMDGTPIKLAASGRHDPCVLPRAVPIVDAMAALVIMDHYLRDRAAGHLKGSE
jgi:chorismate synthase